MSRWAARWTIFACLTGKVAMLRTILTVRPARLQKEWR
jgi:hypothetical protein